MGVASCSLLVDFSIRVLANEGLSCEQRHVVQCVVESALGPWPTAAGIVLLRILKLGLRWNHVRRVLYAKRCMRAGVYSWRHGEHILTRQTPLYY